MYCLYLIIVRSYGSLITLLILKDLNLCKDYFTKRLKGFRDLSYANRLTNASLCTLECRRLKADLILCYKLLHGLTIVSDLSLKKIAQRWHF